MSGQKYLAIFALTTIVIASFLSICTKMSTMTEGFGLQVPVQGAMSHCVEDVRGCLASSLDHMSTLVQSHPFSTPGVFALAILFFVTFAFAWAPALKDRIFDRGTVRTLLNRLKRSTAQTLTPPFLLFAFSKGILNPKIDA